MCYSKNMCYVWDDVLLEESLSDIYWKQKFRWSGLWIIVNVTFFDPNCVPPMMRKMQGNSSLTLLLGKGDERVYILSEAPSVKNPHELVISSVVFFSTILIWALNRVAVIFVKCSSAKITFIVKGGLFCYN